MKTKIKIPNCVEFGIEHCFDKGSENNVVFAISFPDDRKQEFQDWCNENNIKTSKIIGDKNKCIFNTDEINLFDFGLKHLENNLKEASASIKFVKIEIDEDDEYYARINYEYFSYDNNLYLGKCEFESKSQFDLILQIVKFFEEESSTTRKYNDINFDDLTLKRTAKVNSFSHSEHRQIDFYFQFWYKDLLVSEDIDYQKALSLAKKITKKI
jgi:hypothetical protein